MWTYTWTGHEAIPLDDLPAPAANRDRKMRVTFDPNTWPGERYLGEQL